MWSHSTIKNPIRILLHEKYLFLNLIIVNLFCKKNNYVSTKLEWNKRSSDTDFKKVLFA